jgi:hypothetical protein
MTRKITSSQRAGTRVELSRLLLHENQQWNPRQQARCTAMSINMPPSSIICVKAQDLPYDMRRVLRVQFKEFINLIEDAQLSAATKPVTESAPIVQGRFKTVPTSTSAAA